MSDRSRNIVVPFIASCTSNIPSGHTVLSCVRRRRSIQLCRCVSAVSDQNCVYLAAVQVFSICEVCIASNSARLSVPLVIPRMLPRCDSSLLSPLRLEVPPRFPLNPVRCAAVGVRYVLLSATKSCFLPSVTKVAQ